MDTRGEGNTGPRGRENLAWFLFSLNLFDIGSSIAWQLVIPGDANPIVHYFIVAMGPFNAFLAIIIFCAALSYSLGKVQGDVCYVILWLLIAVQIGNNLNWLIYMQECLKGVTP